MCTFSLYFTLLYSTLYSDSFFHLLTVSYSPLTCSSHIVLNFFWNYFAWFPLWRRVRNIACSNWKQVCCWDSQKHRPKHIQHCRNTLTIISNGIRTYSLTCNTYKNLHIDITRANTYLHFARYYHCWCSKLFIIISSFLFYTLYCVFFFFICSLLCFGSIYFSDKSYI